MKKKTLLVLNSFASQVFFNIQYSVGFFFFGWLVL